VNLGKTIVTGALLALSSLLGWTSGHIGTLVGTVRGPDGPVEGATVRVQATESAAVTGTDGTFELRHDSGVESLRLTAWAPGYYIGGGEAVAIDQPVVLHLTPLPPGDDPEYEWLGAGTTGDEEHHCKRCHAAAGSIPLPFDDWLADGHSRSATNHRFLTMYNGTDVAGRQSPPTRYARSPDYGRFPLRPDDEQPFFGPGYRLDFPDTAGNCATCHVPAAAAHDPFRTDPTAAEGVAREGVTCDVCHKVVGVVLDPSTGLPFPNRPGVLSFEFRRPDGDHQLFVGPFDDVAPGEDVYSPLYRDSSFCAPCHFAAFWDTMIYNSFGEWLASPFSDPEFEGAQTCQDCHMSRRGRTHFARLDQGGQLRRPETVASHRMLSGALLESSAQLAVTTRRDGGRVVVQVEVDNRGTGHHLPTGSPLRQVFLVVSATDGEGNPLELEAGPRLPEWAADLEGRPGRAYAKILEELWTGTSPTGAYWNRTRVVEDSRLPALALDRSEYAFRAPVDSSVTASARLVYRRAFRCLAELKGWDDSDLVIAATSATEAPRD